MGEEGADPDALFFSIIRNFKKPEEKFVAALSLCEAHNNAATINPSSFLNLCLVFSAI
jgi:hypothetical protein